MFSVEGLGFRDRLKGGRLGWGVGHLQRIV